MRHQIRAVLFDLDGVVVFTDKYHYLGWKRLSDEQGWEFDEELNHRLRGVPRMVSLQIILDHNSVSISREEKERLASLKNEYYRELLCGINSGDMYPGAVRLLEKIRAEGVKTGLCSSSRNARMALDKLGLNGFFDTVVTGNDIINAKPHPEIFLRAAENLKIPPFHCLVFEDAESGIQAALAAGMKCVGVGTLENLPNASVLVEDYGSIDIDSLLDSGRISGLPAEDWHVSQDNPLDRPAYWETVFALSNGYLGVRGSLEEDARGGAPGTFINSFIGYEDYEHIWSFPGYAKRLHAMLNVCDWTPISVNVDGTGFFGGGSSREFSRRLDMENGLLEKSFEYESSAGNKIIVKSERMVSMKRRHLAAQAWRIKALDPVELRIESRIVCGMPSAVLPGEQVKARNFSCEGNIDSVELDSLTGPDCAGASFSQNFTKNGEEIYTESEFKDAVISRKVKVRLEAGESVELTKIAAFFTTLDTGRDKVLELARKEAADGGKIGFPGLLREHSEFWRDYWNIADIKIGGNEKDRQALRFNLFHLRQSHPEDERRSIGANGVTGDKYCGHVFWDTEMYMLPHFLYTEPEIVRPLLMYRYNILDEARKRAEEMGGKGALFSWNSITGEECCVVFEAATAEYHLESAVAWGIYRYVEGTGDTEFLYDYGAEILFETARFLADLGGFVPLKGDRFCINAVCGPDEYGCGVNNNCYTNSMARWHFSYAARVFEQMHRDAPGKLKALSAKTGLKSKEVDFWKKAADKMYIPYNEKLGIHEQDDCFSGLEPVDMDSIPKNTDLRELMHPLNLWRLQVCKQADVVLLMFVLGHRFDLETKKANYEFYEPKTCHGSSLSACIHSIIAAETGHIEDAYDYFRHSVLMDLNDFKNNTSSGVHSACLGGSWMAVVNGFAGMRDYPEGLRFNPRLPAAWDSVEFKLVCKGRLLKVRIENDSAEFALLDGGKLSFRCRDEEVKLSRENPKLKLAL